MVTRFCRSCFTVDTIEGPAPAASVVPEGERSVTMEDSGVGEGELEGDSGSPEIPVRRCLDLWTRSLPADADRKGSSCLPGGGGGDEDEDAMILKSGAMCRPCMIQIKDEGT